MEFLENDLAVSARDIPADIQGNIVSAYNRTRTEMVFVRMPGNTDAENRIWLAKVLAAGLQPTSAATHEQHSFDGTPLVNVMLTARGLKKLGHEAMLSSMDGAFVEGARLERLQRELNDPPSAKWEPPFRQEWDILFLVAYDGAQPPAALASLGNLPEETRYQLSGNLIDRDGRPLQSTKEPRYEPFGFRDGLSNPIFTVDASEKAGGIAAGVLGPNRMSRPLSCCLARDPANTAGFGSYFVFRKLRQDTDLFQTRLTELVDAAVERAERVAEVQFGPASSGYSIATSPHHPPAAAGKIPPVDYRQAAALAHAINNNPKSSAGQREELRDFILRRAVGRDRNGYPFNQWDLPWSARQQPAAAAEANDFDFQSDREAMVCPMQAHVRKVNPRGLTRDPEERRHVIARRGIPFGQAGGQEDRGLLFLCAQADIQQQFEHLQRRWANNDARGASLDLEPTPGFDNIAAQPPAGNQSEVQYESVELSSAFYRCVELRGAEYLFAPSLAGLKRLTDPPGAYATAASARIVEPKASALLAEQKLAADDATPRGLLSFLFHVTSASAYRTEEHEELDRSFARFAVVEEARDICRDMEKACINLRSPSSRQWEIDAAKQLLSDRCPILFKLVGREMDRLGPLDSRPKADPSHWFGPISGAPDNWLLLDYVYAFCYADDNTVSELERDLPKSRFAPFNAQLRTLRQGVMVPDAVDTLCGELAIEYSQRGWARNW